MEQDSSVVPRRQLKYPCVPSPPSTPPLLQHSISHCIFIPARQTDEALFPTHSHTSYLSPVPTTLQPVPILSIHHTYSLALKHSHTLSIKKMPSPLKRKSNPEAPHAPSKRLRTDGLFTPRVKTPTGASRSIPRASRYQPSSASPAKRTLDKEHVEQGLSSKVRILNNRECLHLLPSRKPLPMPAPALQRKIKPRSPLKNAIIARLSRRRAILSQKQKLERLMERMDSDNVYYFSQGLSNGIKLFTSRSPASFSSKYWTHGLSLEILL